MLKIVRRNKIAIDKLLFQAKTAIIKEGKKATLEYAYNQIPTEQQVILKLERLAKENPQKAKKYYDDIINQLNGIKNKLLKSEKSLNIIKIKLESINSKITYLTTISTVVTPFIESLSKIKLGADAIITTSGAAPGTPPGPIAMSATLKEKIKGIIQKFGSSILLAARIIIIVNKNYILLKRKVKEAETKTIQLINYIDNLLDKLEQLFVEILLPLLGTLDDTPTIETLEDLYSYYPGLDNFLNLDDENLNFDTTDENITDTNNGISNIAPRFYKPYITGSIGNSNTEE